MNKSISKTFLVGGSITVGFITGILLSKSLERYSTKQIDLSLQPLLSQVKKFKQKSRGFNASVRSYYEKNLAKPLPDLYKATEGLILTENELMNDW